MAFGCYLQLSHGPCMTINHGHTNSFKRVELRGHVHLLTVSLSSRFSQQDYWNLHVSNRIRKHIYHVPYKYNALTCKAFAIPSGVDVNPILKTAALALTRSYNALRSSPLSHQLVPAVGIIAFALWGLGPLLRLSRNLFFHSNENNWRRSRTRYVFASYLQPLLLWSGATLICRALDPLILPSDASQVVKLRFLNFVRSLSTVLAFAFCLSSLIQQAQNFFMETNESNDARKMGLQFAGKAVYTAVWVAAFSLFMELLGFSTQKWLTAGGLGTVMLTLAGREIFTNFLSSVMIHATRPFVLNEWIQTKIEGYEVSGTVEHVGWWSPTIIRGDDREAVHIPNHKFTVTVVRNLSQKTHWRVKTHLAISHLDVDKINIIVADMRKVLAKNPQVEQQKLHRRVFLDNIDPENQSLLILISCFVKTSHFEEYLCVKETILLDLLRIIRHHRARLATPIRTVQKIYGDAGIENIPYAETIFSHAGAASGRPLLLIEPPTRINSEERNKGRQVPRLSEEDCAKAASLDPKAATTNSESALHASSDKQQVQKKANTGDAHLDPEGLVESREEKHQLKAMPGDAHVKSNKMDTAPSTLSSPSTKTLLEELDSVAPNSKGSTRSGVAIEKPPVSPSAFGNECADSAGAGISQAKPEGPASPAVSGRPTLEENIVLGVALDGAKRTLPIEDRMDPSTNPVDSMELAPFCSASAGGSPSSTKDKKDGQIPAPAGTAVDQRDQDR
uniref:Mechanosensitive ion channel protein 2, chloroplastic n=1 Tax=Anthurium amnicola TaxID=1678845 RepID=A0A1D1Y139_9ARAE